MSSESLQNRHAEIGQVRRRAWLAALLSFVLPGLGQLYNGDVRKALLWFGVFWLRLVAAFLVAYAFGPAFFLVVTVLLLVLFFAAPVEAFISAWRKKAIQPSWYNKWYVYLGILMLAFAMQFIVETVRLAESFSIPSGSNLPNIEVGDYVGAYRLSWSVYRPNRGDLVVHLLPRDKEIDYLKRVVGLPGDVVQMKKGRLYLNGEMVVREAIEDYTYNDGFSGLPSEVPRYAETLPDGKSYEIIEIQGDEGPLDNTPEFTIPPEHYFVLGDNRDQSTDSRVMHRVGFIPADHIRYRVSFIFGSKDYARIGKVIR